MKFEEITEYFEKIEKADSRLKMTSLLAELFAKAKGVEAQQIIYLSQGQLGPDYKQVEAGIGEKFVIQAISRFSGYTIKETTEKFKEIGDLGLVVEEFAGKKKQQSLFKEDLSLEKVFKNLMKIAKAEGRGSQEIKIKLLTELLNSAGAREGKYIVRIPLGAMRLGIGDPTIMDALALIYLNEFKKSEKKLLKKIKEKYKKKEDIDRQMKFKLREAIEEKYNIHPDLGKIAFLLKEKGLNGLNEIKIEAGTPIRPTLAERLKSSKEIVEKLGKCAVEAKYDGFRCITGHTPIFVQKKGFTSIKDVKKGNFVLTHKGRFQKVIAKNKRKIDKKERLFRIQTYFGNEFKITEKHPLLVYQNKKISWQNPENLSEKEELVFPLPKFVVKEKAPKKLVLTTEDNYSKTIKINKDFFRFIGYWIGDGFTNNYHNTKRIGLVFNARKGKELCKLYERIVRKTFHIRKISKNTHNGAIYLYWRDQQFRKWLSKNFRREWKGKMLPDWFFNISKKQFSEFLQGWVESDGTTDNKGRTTITTKEKDLAMFAQLLGLKFKKIIGVKKIRVKSKKHNLTYYKLILPKSERNARILGNNVLVKILKIQEIKYPDPRTTLYNLQIKKDESYCTTMLSLHNCQIHKKDDFVEIFSRRQEKMTDMFPEIVEAVKKQLKAKEAIIEGEALAFNEETQEYYPFQVTIQRKRKYDVKEKSKEFPLKLFVFDVMMVNGKNLMELPFKERRKKLNGLLKKGKVIELTESIITDNPKKIDEFFDQAVERGLEGIIAKDLNAKYIAGARKFAWIKLKRSYKGELTDSIDAVIIGYFKGKGQRTKFGLGGLLTAVYNDEKDLFESVAKIGTGISEEKFVELEKMLSKIKESRKPARVVSEIEPDFWVKPKYVVEIVADEITKSPLHEAGKKELKEGLALRFPRMIKLRQDKKPEQATTSKEIIKLFKQQKHVKLGEM